MAVTITPIAGVAQPNPIASDDPYCAASAAYDWKIAGLHFSSAISNENPMERAFARVTKDSVDQSTQPGDQALDGWWIRSQTDWSGGAGYEFMEPISEDPIPKTFNWSYGVDVWDVGRIYLHRKPSLVATLPLASGVTPVMTVAYDTAGTPYLYVAVGTDIYRFLVENLKTTGYTVTTLGSPYCTMPSTVKSMVVAEGTLLACTASHGVYRVQATPFRLFKSTAGSEISAWWVKDRLILAAGRSLYESALPGALVDIDTLSPIVSQAETTWRWVSATSGPRGILVAGRGTTSSSISLISLDTDGGLPTLAAPFVVAEFPSNERVQEISAYLSRFVLISTTAGSRLALIDADGTLTYGPLLRTPYLLGKFSTFDRFAWSSVGNAGEGRSGLVRFNLSEISGETRTAWATDLRVPADGGTVVGQEVLGTDYIVMLATAEVEGDPVAYLYASTEDGPTESYGVIQSGAIRMGSTVEKGWARLNLSASPAMIGSITAEVITNEVVATAGTMSNPTYEVEWSIGNEALTSQTAAVKLTLFKGEVSGGGTPVVPTPTPTPTPGPEPGPGEQSWGSILAYSFSELATFWVRWDDLGGGSTGTTPSPTAPSVGEDIPTYVPPSATPILESWALRAVPVIERTELIRLPLLCFDWEVDGRGVKTGAEGSALARYRELVSRVGTGLVVTITDINNDITDLAVVDDLSFKQTGQTSPGSGFGGVIDLVARVL